MPALRKVQTLHLRAVQPSLLQRGAILIEDALRTASIPGADGSRLLLVRHLSLGRIGSAWSPMSVSLLIENCFRQLRSSAVHAEDPDAAFAPAVYFRDEVEPYLSLALRIALGKDTTAWFWARAVRNWQPGMTRKEALRILLFSILATAPGSLAILQLMQTLLRAQCLEELLSSLEPGDGSMLLSACGWSTPAFSTPDLPLDNHPFLVHTSPRIQLLANACRTWGQADERSLWLSSVLLVLERQQLARTLNFESKKLLDASSDKNASALHSDSQESSGCGLQGSATAPAGISNCDPTQFAEKITSEKIRSTLNPKLDLTYRAGLFFLLPVMERTGLPRWLEENPEMEGSSFAKQILLHFLRRLKTPPSDAIWEALEEIEEPAPRELIQFWVSPVRSYCRRVAHIGLQSLICRAGRISATSTHLEVQFPASDADIRIRRCGLDIDPGWLPWFGRVVHFQYLSRGDFDA